MDYHPLAETANRTIAQDSPAVWSLLSQLGRRMYFPSMGILAQSGEAKAKAKRFNATIGTAVERGTAMHLEQVHRQFAGLKPDNLYPYAPSPGLPDLRTAWLEKLRQDTPSLGSTPVSQPMVTNALTHGLSLAGDLFIDAGDTVLLPDKLWENYELNWGVRQGACLSYYPFFNADLTAFNLPALTQALAARRGQKVVAVLNFPNNPTGYTPNREEAAGIVTALTQAAAAGTRLVVVVDDAYYGMFFDESCERESLFGRLAQAHPNLLAVKVDGPTKEIFVWGLRVGFLTFGVAGGTPALYTALEQKAAGILRATISNITHPGQTVVLNTLRDAGWRTAQAAKVAILRDRAKAVAAVVRQPQYQDCWDVYPFNSGYFMCLRLKGVDSDLLRRHLLDVHAIGTITINATDLRVAFSCVECEQIPELFDRIAQGVRALRK